MAIRQYIGARYVPRFVGQWQSNTAYEPLCIVQDSQGNSYTSKKKVPAGIQLSNTEYWIMSANVNAQIQQLQETIEENKEEADEAIGQLNTAVTALDNTLLTYKGSIVEPGKNIVFFGDSLSVGTGASSPSLRFTTLLANNLGMTERNYAVGASGFTIANNTISNQIQRAGTEMSVAEKKNTPIVFIMAGGNDLRHMSSTSISAYATAVNNSVGIARSNFPYSTIVLAQANQTYNGCATYTQWYWMDYAEMITLRTYANSRFLKILHHPGNLLSGITEFWQSDNIHPNDFGHRLLAGYLTNFLLGGDPRVSRYCGESFAWDTELVTQVQLQPHTFRKDDFVVISRGQIRFASAITASTQIGTYNYIAPSEQSLFIPVTVSGAIVGTITVTPTGNVYIAPNPGQSISSAYWSDYIYTYTTASGSD